jgi:hypothetical protein
LAQIEIRQIRSTIDTTTRACLSPNRNSKEHFEWIACPAGDIRQAAHLPHRNCERRPGDILERLLADILEAEIEPSRGAFPDQGRMQMPPGSARV